MRKCWSVQWRGVMTLTFYQTKEAAERAIEAFRTGDDLHRRESGLRRPSNVDAFQWGWKAEDMTIHESTHDEFRKFIGL